MPSSRTPAHDLRVVPHRPERERVLVGVACGAVVFAALIGWWMGGRYAADARDAALRELDVLGEEYRTLRRENGRLEQELGDERLAREVGGVFSEEVRDTLSEQASQIAALEDQIRFYRNLMAGGEAGELQIADLELLERLDGRGVRFRLLLVQAADSRDEIAGHVEVRVVGARDGRSEVLTGVELGGDLEAPLPFRFRYFQRLAGEIRLPQGFEPQGVEIVARSDSDEDVQLQRTFNWELQEV
jgi:hypothetical protein